MKLEDKLNKLIESHHLMPETQVELRPVILSQFEIFDTLCQASEEISKIALDEDGIRKAVVKQIDLEEIKLPMAAGKFIVDDIQKRNDGTYEVHFVDL